MNSSPTIISYHACLDNAQVQAFSVPLIDFPNAFCGGPVLEATEYDVFRQHRANRPVDSFRPNQAYNNRLTGEYIYAGPVYGHFGHFMAEMAHRIVPSQLLGLPGRYLFVTTEGDSSFVSFETLPAFVRALLELCGVAREDVDVINRNTIVERLHLVPQGAALSAYPRPGYLDALAAYMTPRLDRLHGDTARPERLYVSRSGLPRTGSLLGESYVEAQLEREGFHVFRPERHTLTEQMDHYRKAKVLVFPSGSACHGVELLGRRMLNEVLLIPRLEGQAGHFQRVLKPRAKHFTRLDATIYLGSLLLDRSSGKEAKTLGVSLFNPDQLTAGGFKQGFPRFSLPRYAAAATADMTAYVSEVPGEKRDRSSTLRAALLGRFVGNLGVMAWRRLTGRPGLADLPEQRLLTDAEIAEIWAVSLSLPHPHNAFFRVAMLTLRPPGQLAGMRWSELALDRLLWTVTAERTKTGQPLHVALSQPACDLLAELPRAPKTDRVFHAKDRPLGQISQAKQMLDEAIFASRQAHAPGAIIETPKPWSMADLRRTGQQRLREMGYSETLIREATGSNVTTTSRESPQSRHGVPETDHAHVISTWAAELSFMIASAPESA